MGQSSSSSIAIFTRPDVPLDVFSCPVDPPPPSGRGEAVLVNTVYRNKDCRPVPAAALPELVAFWGNKNPELASQWQADEKKGPVTGSVFFSKNKDGLDTLHGALLRSSKKKDGEVLHMELCLADIYGDDTLGGARMEEFGGIAGGFSVGRRDIGHSLVYASSKEEDRTQAAVYKTNFADGKTERLTPPGQYDLSPAVSPSGEMVAVANVRWNKRTGELENQKTDIVVMNVDRKAQGGLRRQILIKDGSWPTWGSDNVIFFHRAVTSTRWGVFRAAQPTWGVFRYDISTEQTILVTPKAFDAMTPAAISETKVAKEMVEPSSWRLPNLHSWVPNWEPRGMRAWPWTWSMPKPNLYSFARSCVALALVLLAAILLGQYMGRRDSPLEQPGWLELEKAMVATVHREVNITSSLSGASIEYLSKATNRYLYLAIVHASVLASRFRPEDLTLLRGKVESLKTEKKILRAKHDTLVKEIDGLAHNRKALDKAESRITELRQQLDMPPAQERKTILKREK